MTDHSLAQLLGALDDWIGDSGKDILNLQDKSKAQWASCWQFKLGNYTPVCDGWTILFLTNYNWSNCLGHITARIKLRCLSQLLRPIFSTSRYSFLSPHQSHPIILQHHRDSSSSLILPIRHPGKESEAAKSPLYCRGVRVT